MKTRILNLLLLATLLTGCVGRSPDIQLLTAQSREMEFLKQFDAAEAGSADAQFEVGTRFLGNGSYSLAAYWLQMSVTNGSPAAMQTLGLMYEKGYYTIYR